MTPTTLKHYGAELAADEVWNVLHSVALINRAEDAPAIRVQANPRNWELVRLNEWVAQTTAALSPEERRANHLLLDGLRHALLPDAALADFPAYLAWLGGQDAADLRNRALRRAARAAELATGERIDPDALLADGERYREAAGWLFPTEALSSELHAEAHALLCEPDRLQELGLSHLQRLWDAHLAAEWRGAAQRLQSQLGIFSRRHDPTATAAETLRALTGRPPSAELLRPFAGIERVVLVPTPHNDRFVTAWACDGVLRLFFGAPPNYPALLRNSPVGHAELRAGLAPLADETRMLILDLLSRQSEVSAQELIGQLGLSQPSVSRQLKELRLFLFERRGEGASKLYSLNAVALDRIVGALERLLAGEQPLSTLIPEELAAQPSELRRFLDSEGRLAAWPSKRNDQRLVLEFLANQFEPGQSYTEKQVNAALQAQMRPGFRDVASLRRDLYDERLLDRELDGSRYWRAV